MMQQLLCCYSESLSLICDSSLQSTARTHPDPSSLKTRFHHPISRMSIRSSSLENQEILVCCPVYPRREESVPKFEPSRGDFTATGRLNLSVFYRLATRWQRV